MGTENSQPKPGKRHSIAALVIALEVILVALVTVEVIKAVSEQWTDYRSARLSVQTNAIVDRLLQAAQHLAFERGRANVLANAPAPATDNERNFLILHRKAADEALSQALQRIGAENAPERAAVLDSYRMTLSLRSDMDAALSLPREQRPPDLAERWVGNQTRLLKNITDLSAATTEHFDLFTATFRVFNRVKVQAFELREATGLESSRYAASIAGTPMTTATLAETMHLRGRGTATWSDLRREAAQLRNAPLNAALTAVEREFFEKFRPLEDRVTAAALAGTPLPVSTSEFVEASIPALDSIVGVITTATVETAAYADVNAKQAELRMGERLAEALLALAAGMAALFVIIFRLLAPLHRIQVALDALATGKTSIDLPLSPRHDEIGLMRNAVTSFRDSLIQREALERELKELSIRDPLTGCLNRRYLEETAKLEFARATRSRSPIGLLMIDVDHFKRFNDRFGHEVGDLVLRAVAESFREHVRDSDLVCRFGGEEFVVLLPGASPEQTVERGEDLRRAVKDLTLRHAGKALNRLSISAGVAFFPVHGQTLATVISAADDALYRAKQEGRDRVLVAVTPATIET
jgi:diguanylate cyclase (GGDEF)-like protein